MANEQNAPRDASRRATLVAGERDTRSSGQLVELLVQHLVRDAALVGRTAGAGHLLADAAEALEFGLHDVARAEPLYAGAAAHDDADPRAFAGLRRLARDAGDRDALVAAYREEARQATEPDVALIAGTGLAQLLLRTGTPAAEVISTLSELEALLSRCSPDVVAYYRAAHEDALLANGQGAAAVQLRAQRWSELRLAAADVDPSIVEAAAVAVAVAADAVGAPDHVVAEWNEVVFEQRRSVAALRPLLRPCYARGDHGAAEALIAEVVDAVDDVEARSRYQYELAMLRAHRLDDRAGSLNALSSAMRGGHVAPLVAASFLSHARAAQGTVPTDEFVDALSIGIDFAAAGAERADQLTRMAARLDADLDMTAAAIEYARDALNESPAHQPAMRLLGAIFTRERRWADLAELGERQLALPLASGERLRLHERLGDLYETELGDVGAAERHYRAVLAVECHLPVVRRLARLLSGQFRWEDLYDHFRESAAEVSLERERLFLLERAADVAETRLRDAALAVEVYRDVLALHPAHAGAIASTGRLLSELGRWDELLELNEIELALTPDDSRVRVGILCRSAEISRRFLGAPSTTEGYYRRALDEDPSCDEALRGLGQILAAQERWDELVDMTEAEMASAASDAHRWRCLAQLGELHAGHTGLVSDAIRCFEELADSSDEHRAMALVWLDRLFEATDNPHERLRVLAARADEAVDAGSRARLSYRMAELLEWRLLSPGRAFDHYVEALGEPVATAVCATALDRIWDDAEVSDDDRRVALRAIIAVAAARKHADRKQLIELAAERGEGVLDPTEVRALWTTIAAEWPADVRAAERCAIDALVHGDVGLAEALRANAPAGPIEAARAHFVALDEHIDRGVLEPVDVELTPALASALAREDGTTLGIFDGAVERDTYVRIAAGQLSLGELRHSDETEVGQRLAIFASRALGDTDSLRREWTTFASGLTDPARATRAWLDLASEDGFSDDERRDWLRRAAAQGCFDPTLRDQLYAQMAGLNDVVGLEAALVEHLEVARPAPPAAAQLEHKLARCLEVQGRRGDAVAALRLAMDDAPTDAAIALEKARLETLGDDVAAARETLEEVLENGVAGAPRIEVLGRLADLHQMNGGDRDRALSALEDAFTLSGEAKEWATRLASAHASFGLAPRAAQLLESALPKPPALEDLRHWQLLAKLYLGQLDARDAAAEILWTLFRAFPDRRQTLAGLEDYYRQNQGSREFADRLGALLADERLPLAPEQAAKLWKYVGEVNFAVLGRFAEAEAAFRRARGLGDSSADLALRLAKSVAGQPGRVRDAVPLLVGALQHDDHDVRLWDDAFQQLEALFADAQMHGRLRIARQVRVALGAQADLVDEHVRRDPTRELAPSTFWSLVAPDLLDAAQIDVLTAVAPLAERVLGKHTQARSAVRGRKLRRDEHLAFDTFLENACRWLGVQRPKVLVGEAGRGAVALDAATYCVPADRIGDADPVRARFWAGYVAGLVLSDFAPYTWADDAMVAELIRAVAGRAGASVSPTMFDDEVGSLLLAAHRRAATQAVEAHTATALAPTRWAFAAQCVADRAGLVMCGDVRTAVEEILVARGWDRAIENPRTREYIVGDARLRSLLLYALGDDHFMARFESGLADRPFLFA